MPAAVVDLPGRHHANDGAVGVEDQARCAGGEQERDALAPGALRAAVLVEHLLVEVGIQVARGGMHPGLHREVGEARAGAGGLDEVVVAVEGQAVRVRGGPRALPAGEGATAMPLPKPVRSLAQR